MTTIVKFLTGGFVFLWLTACTTQSQRDSNYWVKYTDPEQGTSGYLDARGDTVIPAGTYLHCFTDTFRTYAIVINANASLVGIDRTGKELYEVFMFDNGPDYPGDGLFRILQGNKFGYADAATGAIVIPPSFACAYPFADGKAKVSDTCESIADGEHKVWESTAWYYINKQGDKVAAPATGE